MQNYKNIWNYKIFEYNYWIRNIRNNFRVKKRIKMWIENELGDMGLDPGKDVWTSWDQIIGKYHIGRGIISVAFKYGYIASLRMDYENKWNDRRLKDDYSIIQYHIGNGKNLKYFMENQKDRVPVRVFNRDQEGNIIFLGMYKINFEHHCTNFVFLYKT